MSANLPSAEAATNDLPAWNLDDLYTGPKSDALEHDFGAMAAAADAFHQTYAGKLDQIGAAELGEAIAEYERIDDVLGRIMSYGYLVYAGDMDDPHNGKFFQSVQERINDISKHLVFFTLELNRLDEDRLHTMVADTAALAHYRPWLDTVRAFRPHQLEDVLERFLHDKGVVGRNAWNRLFDETISGLRFPIGGHDLTSTDALNKLTDPDRSVRKDAGQVIGKVLSENVRTFALITNTLAKDKEIEDRWRQFANPVAARNLSNQVEDGVVDALVTAVKRAYPSLSHRYYALKARWFGGEHLDYWDRNAPLPDVEDSIIAWSDARDIVLDSYRRFSPNMADIGQRFFDRRWIDAGLRPGKAPGAFAHPTVPSAHPYILLNYHGKSRDVMTLAHELGHGVHQVLAGDQGSLMAATPLTLAETASVFGEMLTFQALLARETDPAKRRFLLVGKVEDMLNTVVRQIAFYDFEWRVHAERRLGELTAERLGELWIAVQTESLGPSLRFDDGYHAFWSYIPHFIHSPFYVYAYAFGECLVNSLYAVYEEADGGFAERYLGMLRAGGTKRHHELLAPFGLDARDPSFWDKGLAMIGRLIDQLEGEQAA